MATEPSEEIAKLRANVAALKEAVFQHFGTMTALEVVLLALVEAHPNPTQLHALLDLGLERVHADFLAGSPSETALEHFQATSKRAADICEIAIAAQSVGK